MPESEKGIRLSAAIAVTALMAGIFISLTQPITSPDFWWHLATGKWIWQQGSLMGEDPFNFMSFPGDDPLRKAFFLKQYWLAQVLLYAVYLLSGFRGLIVFRALVLSLMFLCTYRLSRRAGGGALLAGTLVFLSWWVIVREIGYTEIRPQMFSSLMAVCLVLILEKLRDRRPWALYALPALMLLWSNMHAGFTLGTGIIVIYTAGMALRREPGRAVYISLASAMALSLANPNGYDAFLMLAAPFLDQGAGDYMGGVVEHISVFSYSGLGGVIRRMPVFSAMLFLSAASFILVLPMAGGKGRIRLELGLLYIALLLIAVSGVRYIVFFVTIGAFITASNCTGFFSGLWQRLPASGRTVRTHAIISAIVILIMAGSALTEGLRTTGLRYPRPYGDEYAQAVDYMKRNNIFGRIFNDYGPGGYLIWSLYPGSEVFIDGRRLSLRGSDTGRLALDNPFYREPGAYGPPLYQKLSAEYGIEAAVLPGCDRVSGVLIRLSVALLEDISWHVVYADRNAMVLLKEAPGTREFIEANGLLKGAGYRNILSMAEAAGNTYYGGIMPGRKLSMAVGLWGTGEYAGALKWLDAYEKQVPRDALASHVRNEIYKKMSRLRQGSAD